MIVGPDPIAGRRRCCRRPLLNDCGVDEDTQSRYANVRLSRLFGDRAEPNRATQMCLSRLFGCRRSDPAVEEDRKSEMRRRPQRRRPTCLSSIRRPERDV